MSGPPAIAEGKALSVSSFGFRAVSRSRAWAAVVALLVSVLVSVGGAAPASAVPGPTYLYVAAGGNLNSGQLPLNTAATESVTVTLTNADTATKFTMTNDARNETPTNWPMITLSAVESGTTTPIETTSAVIQLVFSGIDTRTAYPGYSFDSGTTWNPMNESVTGLADYPKYKFGVDSVTVWTKNLGIFLMHKAYPGSWVTSASSGYLAETGTATLSSTAEGTFTYSSLSSSTCTVSGNVVTGVETTTPISACLVMASRLADSIYSQATAPATSIVKFSKVSVSVSKTLPLVAQLPVGLSGATVESATITMEANSLETDTRFTLTPLARRSSGLPSFSLTAVDSATGTTSITTFLKPVKIELPSSDTTTALPAYRQAGSDTWTVIAAGDSATVAAMVDTSTATGYEVTATGFIIWTRHMTGFGVQAEQGALSISVGSASLTVGGTTTITRTADGSGSGAYSYSSDSAHCTISGTTITAATAGSCNITVTRAGDSVYAPKTSAAVAVTVAAAPPNNSGGTGGGGGAPPIVSTGVGAITGTATYDSGGTVKCEAPVYSQTPTSVKFTWSGIASGSVTVTTSPWLASITIPAKTDGTLNCEILATGTGSTASSQVTFKIDKPAPAPTPVVTPTPEPTPTPVAKAQYKIKCVKWNKKVSGPSVRYKVGNNPKCWAGYKQTARTKVS